MIVFICHDDSIIWITTNSGRSFELSVQFARTSKFVMKFAVFGENLDAIVGTIGNLK